MKSTGERDPDMHLTKKDNQWHLGMKTHAGIAADPGLEHTVTTTAANVQDATPGPVRLSRLSIASGRCRTNALIRIATSCATDVHILKGEYLVALRLTIGYEPLGSSCRSVHAVSFDSPRRPRSSRTGWRGSRAGR
jgi:hypothetical protein